MSGSFSPASTGPAWHDVLHTLANPIVRPPSLSMSPMRASSGSSGSSRKSIPHRATNWSDVTMGPASQGSGGASERETQTTPLLRPRTMASPSPSSQAVHKATPFVPRLLNAQSPPAVKSRSARQAFIQSELQKEAEAMASRKDIAKKRTVTEMIAAVPWKNPPKRVKSGRSGSKRARATY